MMIACLLCSGVARRLTTCVPEAPNNFFSFSFHCKVLLGESQSVTEVEEMINKW